MSIHQSHIELQRRKWQSTSLVSLLSPVSHLNLYVSLRQRHMHHCSLYCRYIQFYLLTKKIYKCTKYYSLKFYIFIQLLLNQVFAVITACKPLTIIITQSGKYGIVGVLIGITNSITITMRIKIIWCTDVLFVTNKLCTCAEKSIKPLNCMIQWQNQPDNKCRYVNHFENCQSSVHVLVHLCFLREDVPALRRSTISGKQ